MVQTIRPLDDKIVVMGMSCVGKTTFALELRDHHYYCFDAYFFWHTIEALGLSISGNLAQVAQFCKEPKYVLDGWHLADKEGELLPPGVAVYVVYAPYDRIIDQYRVPVRDREEHRHMFRKWYHQIDYPSFKSRYFLNEGQFVETTEDAYLTFLEQSR